MRPTATFLIGLPASGKTTYRLKLPQDRLVTISSDDLIDQWAREHGVTYTEAFRAINLRDVERQMMAALDAAVLAEQSVVIDRTNMSRKSRAKLLGRLPQHYQRIAVAFEVPRDELERRLAARAETTGKYIPPYVIETMLEQYEPPTHDEFEVIV